ncbi:leucine-rich repeat-containing protein 28-like [Anopheles nili]|uniref:leucine-rich repeat-containing protein 28-like n=1 Tax=Anopheles nili TaxID=185578 RepID=UPI00237BFA6D|nr:leucine-rich repeat-containing protein 28-like [Anopheles nili]
MEGGFRSIMHLSYRDYSSVPEELRAEGCEAIDEIYLKANLIRSIPDWFFPKMTHLRFLCLAGNMIENVPNQIGHLECLESLDLSENDLHRLPPSLGLLNKLTKLLLNGNFLHRLPPEIGHLNNLQVLDIRKNRLTYVPIELSQCSSLEDLLMDDNLGLVSIPTRLFNLPALCYVSAERCNLFQLPFNINTSTLRFVLLFSNNHCLTHCPLALERFALPDYDALKDKMKRIRNPSCYRRINCSPVPYCLNFPSELIKMKSRHALTIRPYTLLEAALRACAGFGVPVELLMKFNLPHCLKLRLTYGPVACCTNASCGREIFTEGVLMLLKRREYARNFVLSALFCSKLCADGWFQYNCSTYEELPWNIPV